MSPVSKTASILSAVALTAASMTMASSARAEEEPPAVSVWYMQNHHSLKCAEDTDAGVASTQCLGFRQHRWASMTIGIESIFVSVETQGCLRDSGGFLETVDCAPDIDLNQRWQLLARGNGKMLKNSSTGLCVDDTPPAKILTYACHSGVNQRFWLVPAPADGVRPELIKRWSE